MAEGGSRDLGGDSVEVQSAGIEAHGKKPRTVAVMAEAGVEVSGQGSTVLSDAMLKLADVVEAVGESVVWIVNRVWTRDEAKA